MEAAPQLKASGLDGGCRILADFGGRMFRPLQRRLRDELNRQPFRFFLSAAHRERWTHWKNRCYTDFGKAGNYIFDGTDRKSVV